MTNFFKKTAKTAVLAILVFTNVPVIAYADAIDAQARSRIDKGVVSQDIGGMKSSIRTARDMPQKGDLQMINGNEIQKPDVRTEIEKIESREQNYVPGEVLVKFKKNNINLKSSRGSMGAKSFASKRKLAIRDEIKGAKIGRA